MRKKMLSLGLVTLIGTTTLITPLNSKEVYANTNLLEKKEDIQNKRSNIKSNIENKENKILTLEKNQKKLDVEIKSLDNQMTETNKSIRQRQSERNDIQKKIEELKAKILEIKERIEERNRLLEDRVRSLQENGGVVRYLDVVLKAQDFSDLISRIEAVTTIINADREIILAHEKDMKLLEQSERTLHSEVKKLEILLDELESLRKQVSTQIDKKNTLLAQVQIDYEQAETDLYKLEDEEAFLAEQESAIQKEIERQKQLEERKRIEAEKVREKAVNSLKNSPSTLKLENDRETETKQTSGLLPTVEDESKHSAKQQSILEEEAKQNLSKEDNSDPTDINFIWPAKGTFTSGYGSRWGKLHGGIDIANSTENVPVVAAADGTVIRSYYSSSYGNAVFISHNLNGKVYTTVYAHLDSRLVSSGQAVRKGQQIGYMGNTGQSTGKHLHFEIHDGAWKNPVDPMQFLQ